MRINARRIFIISVLAICVIAIIEGVYYQVFGDKNVNTNIGTNEENIIIDYRSKYFEEQEKNKELQVQIDELNHKLEEIKKVIN